MKFLLISAFLHLSIFALAQDTAGVHKDSLPQKYFKNEVRLDFASNAVGGQTFIGLSYLRFINAKNSIDLTAAINKEAYGAKLGYKWYLKPEGEGFLLGTSFLYSKRYKAVNVDDAHYYKYTTNGFNFSVDMGYAFVIRDRFTIQPLISYLPFDYLYLKYEEGVYNFQTDLVEGSTFEDNFSFSGGYFSAGLNLGFRF